MENSRILVKCIKDCLDIKNGEIVELEEYGSYINYIRDLTFYRKDHFLNLSLYRKELINNLLDML
jgi:hypothetical protein